MTDLNIRDITYCKNVGAKRADILRHELHAETAMDLLRHYPFRYTDRSRMYHIADIADEDTAVQIRGRLLEWHTIGVGKGQRLSAQFSDGYHVVELVWFRGISYLKLDKNREYLLFGKPSRFNHTWNFVHPELTPWEKVTKEMTEGLEPEYPTTERMKQSGLNSRAFRAITAALMPDLKQGVQDTLGGDVLAEQVDIAMVSREVSPEEAQKGAIGFPTAKDAVVPTINQNNPFYAQLVKHGINKQAASDLWIEGKIKTWGQLLGTQDQTKIALFTRSDACGAAETFAKWLGKHQEDLLGEGVNGDPGVATAVSKNELSIGFNNIGYAYDNNTLKPLDGIRVLPVDGNDNGKIDPDEEFYGSKDQITKAIAEGRYPSPPARDLYLVTKGLPTNPVVIAFLKYVLTDGQKLNAPVGYIEIPQEKLDKALGKLK